ncbi:MAG: pyruvate, phosphate dikinase, partial [Saprospiraceae bacterium]|nr:pyruvate, phosphate dikinase [Saprospiraceae bacterium]
MKQQAIASIKSKKSLPTGKYVYVYGDQFSEGDASMKALLGGKGANLAEMNRVGIPVPPGFTLTTKVCTLYGELGREKTIELVRKQVKKGIAWMERIMHRKFGDDQQPLLLSVRSGARASMPGMMDTVLNLGLNDRIVGSMIAAGAQPRFVWDSYRRLVQMYGDVVMGLKPANKEDEDPFEVEIHRLKKERDVELDTDLTADDLCELVHRFKQLIREGTGEVFPDDPMTQLWGAVMAVFSSWNNERARVYRKLNDIPDTWGTAVNVQAMVYGNLNENSATGVAFTRDAATGENIFNGEYLFNAQGEDVVAGIRTPRQVTLEGARRWAQLARVSEEERAAKYQSLEEAMPEVFAELMEYQTRLERHYRDMQDLEFTVQDGKLWLLQTRSGKRTGVAMVKIAMDMLREGMIDGKTTLLRVDPIRLNELLLPVFEPTALKEARPIARGLPASPGAATGQIVFFADDAEAWKADGQATILVRVETSPEDLRGMHAAQGILTARGGMTSHAAVVARGMGTCCISGAGAIEINYAARTMTIDGDVYREGDWISLNGSTGEVLAGKVATHAPELSGDFGELMKMADLLARMEVRTNADTPREAAIARQFNARGIGLCRTEHMFFEGDRIWAVREMILANDKTGRIKALDKLLPMQRSDFEGIFEVMHDLPVTIRLLDPPLHEFLPHGREAQAEMARHMDVPVEVIQRKMASLEEINPMLGHRGCRLGITYPEVTRMQARAIFEAAL